jgi:hypothetical protein
LVRGPCACLDWIAEIDWQKEASPASMTTLEYRRLNAT